MMAWTTPLTAVANAALTAAQWNASVRDNLLETAAAKASTAGSYFAVTGPNAIAERIAWAEYVSGAETTTSTSFTDLATGGPAAAITSGTRALVTVSANMSNNTVNAVTYMSVDISGATTLAAASTRALTFTSSTANAQMNASLSVLYTVTAGSNTYTAKYQVSSGTGTFSNRRLTILPF